MTIKFEARITCDHLSCHSHGVALMTMEYSSKGKTEFFVATLPEGWTERHGMYGCGGVWHYCPKHKDE